MTGESHTRQWRLIGIVVAAVWVVAFAYLLFVDDPPDFFWDDIAVVDGPAHFVGGMVTGVIAYVLAAGRPRRLMLAVVGMAGVVVALELFQDLFSSRKWENSDVGLALAGGFVGVVCLALLTGFRNRSR